MYEFMLVFSVVLFLVVCAIYGRHRAASIFHPLTFYLMFHGIVFVIRPIFAWVDSYDMLYGPIGFQPTMWQKTVVLICTNLGLAVFSAVCLWIANEPLQFRTNQREINQRGELLQWYWFPAAIMAALGLWSAIWSLQFMSTGDIADIRAMDAKTGGGYLTGVSGYFINLALMLSSLVAIIAFLGRFRWWSLLPFAFYAVLKLGGGGRGQVVSSVSVIVLLYLLDKRRSWPTWPIFGIAAAGMLVFSAIGEDRGAGIREALGMQSNKVVAEQADTGDRGVLETMDLANMEFFEYLVWAVPERTGTYDYFVHQLQILTEPIPRTLWKDKPIGPPIRMFELYRYGNPLGATSSVPGVGWIGMGYVGVVIWSAFFAAMYAYGYRAFARSTGSNVAAVAYTIFVCTSIVAYRDGAPITILKQLQFYFVPVLALWLVSIYLQHRNPVPASTTNGAGNTANSMSPRQRRLAVLGGHDKIVDGPPALSPDTPRARRRARMGAVT
jgi:hypothetical protein